MDIEEFKTDVARMAVDLLKGVDGPKLNVYLEWLARSKYNNGDIGWTKETIEAVKQAQRMAWQRVFGRRRDLRTEILEYMKLTETSQNLTEILRNLTILTKQEKSYCYRVLHDLTKDGVLERVSHGHYRLVKGCEFVDWCNTSTAPVPLYLPLELSSPDYTIITPGDIVLIMGSPNSGKTAMTINIARNNYHQYNTYYFSTEISAASFRRRLEKFKNVTIDQLKEIKFSDDFGDFSDAIQPGEGSLNIIDYLEVYENFWEIGAILNKIHKKLDRALAVINIQKNKGAEFGIGGNFSQMKPMLSISLDYGNVATITKCKEWNENISNPNGKVYHYKLVDGCEFRRKRHNIGWVNRDQGGIDHGI